VTLDPLLTGKAHAATIKEKVLKRNNVLKALSGTSWGKDKETLLTTFKATAQSLLNYCCPIWTPGLSETNWNELQISQNACLRTSTGCVKMSSADHLHTETKNMPVKEHCSMISKQFLLATTKPDHPNHIDLNEPPPPRIMKETLTTRFSSDIASLVPESGSNTSTYKSGLQIIHTRSVQNVINNQSNNPILQEPAPPIHKSESELPRQARVTLAQLRSGYSSHLNQYLAWINPTKYSEKCPDCNLAPHSINHLFTCPEKPTNLTPRSLWTEPTAAAKFLGLTTDGIG